MNKNAMCKNRVFALFLTALLLLSMGTEAAARVTTWYAATYPDGRTAALQDSNERGEEWQQAMEEQFRQVDRTAAKYANFRLYKGIPVDAEKTPTNFRLGFAPYFRRDQLEIINEYSIDAGLPGFDWKTAKTLDVVIGLFRCAMDYSVTQNDAPFVTFVGILDPEDHSRLLGASVQLTSIPLQRKTGERYIENTLYSTKSTLYDSYQTFYGDAYLENVPLVPSTDIEDKALTLSGLYGGCLATDKQSAALLDYFGKRKWAVSGTVSQVRPNSAFPEDSTPGPSPQNAVLAVKYAKADGLVGKGYKLKGNITTFYHATEERVTGDGVPYLLTFCAVLSGSEGKGYKVSLPWIEVVPGKWHKDDSYTYESSTAVATVFPLSSTLAEIEEFVYDIPGMLSADKEWEEEAQESEQGCTDE